MKTLIFILMLISQIGLSQTFPRNESQAAPFLSLGNGINSPGLSTSPIQLCFLDNSSAFIQANNKFGLTELNTNSIGISFNKPITPFLLQLSKHGFQLHHQTNISLAGAIKISKYTILGTEFGYLHEFIAEQGFSSYFQTKLSLAVFLSDKNFFTIQVNPVTFIQSRARGLDFNIGFNTSLGKSIEGYFNLRHNYQLPLSGQFALLYSPKPKLHIYYQITNNPNSHFIAIGCRFEKFLIQPAIDLNMTLGLSSSIRVTYLMGGI